MHDRVHALERVAVELAPVGIPTDLAGRGTAPHDPDHLAVARPPVPDERLAVIEQNLSRATGQTVVLTARVDPALIGGAVTRVGSTVYDVSVVRQLARLKEQLQTS